MSKLLSSSLAASLLISASSFSTSLLATDVICSMDEFDKLSGELKRINDVAISVPEQSSREVKTLSNDGESYSIEEWEITPAHSNYRYRMFAKGDMVKVEESSMEAETGRVTGSIKFDPSPYLRIRGSKEKQTKFTGQCYLKED